MYKFEPPASVVTRSLLDDTAFVSDIVTSEGLADTQEIWREANTSRNVVWKVGRECQPDKQSRKKRM
jgi:hypothetical protein